MSSSSLRTPLTMPLPDPRQEGMLLRDSTSPTGFRPRTLEDHHQAVQQCALNDSVPEDIRQQWEVARNLFLYFWNVYDFCMPAQLQAYAVLELALKTKFDLLKADWTPPLSKLMQRAIVEGLWHDDGLERSRGMAVRRISAWADDLEHAWQGKRNWPDMAVPDRPHVEVLAELIPEFRNSSAHGSTSLMPMLGLTFRDTRDLINMLYVCTP